MTSKSYGLFDVDNHYYESQDAYSRYLEPEYSELAPTKVGGEQNRPQGQENWVMRPGSLKEYLRKMKSGAEEEPYLPMEPLPAFHDREARIKLMEPRGLAPISIMPSRLGTPSSFGVRVACTRSTM